MIKYTVCDRFDNAIYSAFRIAYDFQEIEYLKEKYNFHVKFQDLGNFLIVKEETNEYIVKDDNSFNARFMIVDLTPIYPAVPFKNADDRPKLNAFRSGSVHDWMRKQLGSIAHIDTDAASYHPYLLSGYDIHNMCGSNMIRHLDIREMKKEKNTMYGKSKTINFCVKKVIFNGPATIVIWGDGTKTVVKCKDGDSYSKWAGFAMCIAKRLYGEDFHFIFRHWCGVEDDIPKKNTTGDRTSISEAFKDLGKSACDCAESLSKALEGYSKVPDYRDVVFKDTFETGLVLKNMRNIIDTLGFVSVADCCHLVGAMIHIGDHDIGWTDISKAMIVRVKNGFLIKYPEPASRSQPNEAKDLD